MPKKRIAVFNESLFFLGDIFVDARCFFSCEAAVISAVAAAVVTFLATTISA